MSNLDDIVYIVEGGKVIESAIRDLNGFIEETTTPHGIAPKLHVRGNELWTWGHCGNFPKRIAAFETETEAQEALEDAHARDFWDSCEFVAFGSREDAEQAIIEGNA